jgi:bacteriocin-like protein
MSVENNEPKVDQKQGVETNAQLSEQELKEVSGGLQEIVITKSEDKSSNTLFQGSQPPPPPSK